MTIISAFFWGTSFVAIKWGLGFIDAYWFALLRLIVASAGSLLVLIATKGFDFSFFQERAVWLIGVLNGFGFILQYVGLLFTTAGRTSLLVNVNVVFVAILSWMVFGEHFGKRKNLGVIFGILGVILLTTNGEFGTVRGSQFLGDVIEFGSGLAWSLVPILWKGLLSRGNKSVIPLTTGVLLITTATILPFTLVVGGQLPSEWRPELLLLIVYTGILCTTVPVLLSVGALRLLTATVSSIILLLEIVVAVTLSFLLLGEFFTLYSGLGGVLILASIAAVMSGSSE